MSLVSSIDVTIIHVFFIHIFNVNDIQVLIIAIIVTIIRGLYSEFSLIVFNLFNFCFREKKRYRPERVGVDSKCKSWWTRKTNREITTANDWRWKKPNRDNYYKYWRTRNDEQLLMINMTDFA